MNAGEIVAGNTVNQSHGHANVSVVVCKQQIPAEDKGEDTL